MTHNSTLKASIITSIFSVAALIGFLFGPAHPYDPTPQVHLLGLYLLVLAHTFLSVRCFSAIIDPTDRRQWLIDAGLVVSYVGLAWNIKDATSFWLWWFGLFFLATIKYVLLIGRLHHKTLLRRKITADLLGMVFPFVVTYLSILSIKYIPWVEQNRFFSGPVEMGSLAVFALASAYYFFIRPLYVPDKMSAL
ncbi:MAG: hypothetical protein AAB668_03880 [Patescibacteria group bacterium]